MKRFSPLVPCLSAALLWCWSTPAARATQVFSQDFSSSTTVSSYVNATSPSASQFNSITAGGNAGTFTINGGTLQLARTGSSGPNQVADLTRSTDLAGPPAVLAMGFDLRVTLNSWQSGAMTFAVGHIPGPQGYDVSGDTFFKWGLDGASTNGFRFNVNGAQSALYAADGTSYRVTVLLNKSGAAKTYQGLDGNTRSLSNNSAAFWVNTTCLFDNVAATNGATSTLADFHFLWAAAENGVYRFDNFNVNDSLPGANPPSGPGKIPLTASMIINEGAIGNAATFVDEQAASGDPTGNPNSVPPDYQPSSAYNVIGDVAAWTYPASFVVDLGANYALSKVAFFDANGQGNVTFSTGTPFNWTPLFTDGQNLYNQWSLHPVNVTTRYVRMTIASGAAIPTELLLYGTLQGTAPTAPNPTTPTPAVIDNFVGVNTFINEPLHRQQAAGFLREFHDWEWIEGHDYTKYPGYPNNQNAFDPAWTGDHWDTFYSNLQFVGLPISPAVSGSTLWLAGSLDPKILQRKPFPANSSRDALLPASYVEHADHMFQEAARYGNTAVGNNLLKLRSDNPRRTGLGLVHYYEDWNEPDKTWIDRASYFAPYEYAAMASADYDGDRGALGTTVGVKNADPSAVMVMAGLANASLDYLKAVKFWCDFKRGGSFPFGVLNVHQYSNNGPGQYNSTAGVSPEAYGLKAKMAAIRLYRDTYLPGVPLWVSEFGYDTNPASQQGAPTIGGNQPSEVQGQWLIRSYLALLAAGVDRAIAFTLVDQGPPSSTGTYATSGLVGQDRVPKPAWYYVYTLRTRLAGLHFDAEQASGNANVLVYRFANASGKVAAYAVWCPTSNATTVSGYSLTLQGSHTSAAQVALANGSIGGTRTTLAISGGTVTLDVSERPTFVLLDGTNTTDPVMSNKITLTRAMVTNESGLGDAGALVDEQTLAGDPRDANGGKPQVGWTYDNPPQNPYPLSAYIDLGAVRQIDRVYLYDFNNTGDVTISTGAPGAWTPLFTDPLGNYDAWNEHVVNASTRYLRVTRASSSANLNEIVIYGK